MSASRLFRSRRSAAAGLTLAVSAALAPSARAGDVTWTNGSGNFLWDTSSLNWNTGAWNNASGDGAIFNAAGAGTLSLPGPVSVDSLVFNADGYALQGAGPINFVSGVSTQTTGVVNVATGFTTRIFNAINSNVGFQKIGGGVLEISGPGDFGGAIPLNNNGTLRAVVLIGGTSGTINGGTLRVMTPAALPFSSRVSIGTGFLDIGNNNVEIDQLIFTNQNPSAPWNSTLRANNGVIGAGTLRVKGDIAVIGVLGLNAGNSIAANLDLGGNEQVVRCGIISSGALQNALMLTGVVSNGSLVKTVGLTAGGTFGSVDGIALHGANTYTGPTIINSGTNVATNVNQSGAIRIHGVPAGPAGGSFALLGANGAFPMAMTVQASAGGIFALDNNLSLGASGLNQPNIPAAQNNDRINDAAAMTLRDGTFVYRGFAAAAASETFGSLRAAGGHNVVTITPNGGGSVTLTAAGSLSLAARATLAVSATGTGNALGGTAKLFVNGSVPTADATGILPRVVSSTDFLTYSPTTGLTPFAAYAPDFNTPGANVSLAAASVAPTATVNAIKRSGTFVTTIGPTDTVTVTSGMILNATGTGTFTGGTIAFGAAPGVLFGGTTFVGSALTGSDGLIHASGTGTLAGNLSGLSGELSTHAATTNLNTNTFTGPITVRAGTISLNTSQTGANLGAVTLGVPENDVDLIGTTPNLVISGAGANATFDRDLIVDNAAETAKGILLSFSTLPTMRPLVNLNGSQTWNGDVELRSSLNFQGGAGTGTGATFFTGKVSGPGRFVIPNGRVVFTADSEVLNGGGFWISGTGFTAQVTFGGTSSGSAPIVMAPGNNSQVRYVNGGLPGGPITVTPNGGTGVPTFIPLNNSSVGNAWNFDGSALVDVAGGIKATWSGPVAGPGSSTLVKVGSGTLELSSALSTFNGALSVDAGTVEVDGIFPAAAITVATGAALGGNGAAGGLVTVNSGGALAPGGSIGTLTVGGLALSGTLQEELALTSSGVSAADLLVVNGTVSLSNATLDLVALGSPLAAEATILVIANDGADPVSGAFGTVTGLPAGFSATIDYAFAGVDSLGRVGTGNDVAIRVVPEPAAAALLGLCGLVAARRRRR